MSPAGKPHTGCPVGELFAMLGQPHMLRILDFLISNQGTPLRFGTLQAKLGLAPKTLAQRLHVLVEAGLLTRHSYNEIPPRVEYEVTPKALELGAMFPILERWAQRNSLAAPARVSIVGKVASPPVRA